ncbi:MAG: hypothetical protein MUO82_10040, partial [Candidatus Thermoplasmatota archaeon]|nr:hypothetical protein [Candidatus Thermoplasmatota archaeon]
MSRKKLTPKQIKKIREKVQSGEVKYSVAEEMGISYQLVYYYTKDLPSSRPGNRGIRGKTLEVLKQLLNYGYVDSTRECSQNLRTLRKHFPVIQRAQVDGKSFYFLNDKNKITLKAVLEKRKSKIISYHDLARISQVFNVNLSSSEKKMLIGKKEKHVLPIIRRKNGGFISSLKKNQTKLDNFNIDNAFFRRTNTFKSQKIHHSKNDSLLEKI